LKFNKRVETVYLFFCVSTALITRAPLVPGSFTYSNFGGGAGGGGGALNHLFVSASAAEVVGGGRSSDRLLSALLIILGINRDERGFIEVGEVGMIDIDDTI